MKNDHKTSLNLAVNPA